MCFCLVSSSPVVASQDHLLAFGVLSTSYPALKYGCIPGLLVPDFTVPWVLWL